MGPECVADEGGDGRDRLRRPSSSTAEAALRRRANTQNRVRTKSELSE